MGTVPYGDCPHKHPQTLRTQVKGNGDCPHAFSYIWQISTFLDDYVLKIGIFAQEKRPKVTKGSPCATQSLDAS